MADSGRRGADEGAVLVMAALLLTGLMVVAAIVVDLGHMRGMRASNQSVVDLAALAAGDALSSSEGADAPTACSDAVRYLRLNAAGLAELEVDCGSLPSTCLEETAWSAATPPVTVTASKGGYDVAITFPVSDAMIGDSSASGGLRVDDGEPCQRMRIELEQRSSSFFAGIVGVDELTSQASAVVRQVPEQIDQVPSLWLLDPYGCEALRVSGGGTVRAGSSGFGGLISLDSDGSACGNSGYTINVMGSGTRLHAVEAGANPPPRIALYAMAPGQRRCDEGNLRACDPSDVNLVNPEAGALFPHPERRAQRATRAPVDHRFNCRIGENPYPEFHGLTLDACDGSRGNYIDQLRAEVGTVGSSGFQTFNDCSPSGYHQLDGNYFVNCSQFTIGSGTHVEFTGGNVIFAGGVRMTGGLIELNTDNPQPNLPEGCLGQVTDCRDESSAEAAWVYLRQGSVRSQGGAIRATNTSIIQQDGDFQMNAGAPPVWSAPTEGPFTSLALWSEKATSFDINGGADMSLTGIFFTPEATFDLSGGSPSAAQAAQFIAFRARIAGGGTLELAPLEIEPVIQPAPGALLIR